MTDTTQPEFSVSEAFDLVRDLMTPNPWIYWTDFLFHISLGWAAFFVALTSPFLSFWQIGAFIVSVLALYRSAIFIHELTHLKKGTFKVFRITWNVLCGIPLMIPSFTYDGVHNNHHKPDVYGTEADGEYVPFATKKPIEMVGYVLLSIFLPGLLVIRFLILTPLRYLFPSLQKLVWERASSMTIDPSYKRAENAIRNDRNWPQQEMGACLFAALMIGCVLLDVLSSNVLVLWYLIAFTIFLLNSLRTLAAHAYRNPGQERMSFSEQYLDSINIPGNKFITGLWAPVGLRYHATHHLFMSMPYHNLGKAQERLVNGLSDNTLYLTTVRHSLKDALKRIWHESSTYQSK